jgi:iron-sulfur cluster repair protein YtfE (RIC family)
MPSVISLLKQDRRTVEKLFSEFEGSGESSVADQICDEIDLHAQVEEQVVYPVLREDVSAEMADHAEEEHAEARQIIGRIRQTTNPEHLGEVVGELKSAIEEHVQEEESEVFPKMESTLGTKRLERLGEEVQQLKSQS